MSFQNIIFLVLIIKQFGIFSIFESCIYFLSITGIIERIQISMANYTFIWTNYAKVNSSKNKFSDIVFYY